MNQAQFLQELQEFGYPNPVEVQQPPNGYLKNHTHLFAVRALVLNGFIDIETRGAIKRYTEGDVFQLAFEETHAEWYGPEGVRYLASRKN